DGLTPDGVSRSEPRARLSAGCRAWPAGGQLPQRGDPAPAATHGGGVDARCARGAGRTRAVRPSPARDRGRTLALPALRPPAVVVREHSGIELARPARALPQLQGTDLDPVSAGGTADRAA